jgi:hypothetical protein
MSNYRIIHTFRGPGDPVWTLVQDGDDEGRQFKPQAYSTREEAEAAKAEIELHGRECG